MNNQENSSLHPSQQKSDLVVPPEGYLCEILDLTSGTYIHVFNGIREDRWVGLSFSFHPSFISRELGW